MELPERIENASKVYTDNLGLRAYIQMIPIVGGSVDLLLTSKWHKISQKRLEIFIEAVTEEFALIEETKVDRQFLETEEFFDLVIKALNLVIKTRSSEKIKLYAKILQGSLTKSNSTFHAEDYLNVLEELTEKELVFAKCFYELKSKNEPYLKDDQNDISYTSMSFLNVSKEEAQFFFQRLEKVGLVKELVGSFIGYGGGVYNITDLFNALMDYLSIK